jgi:hypothetical protein
MANSSSSVVFGDKRRAREALELAFNDYLHSDNTEISAVIRNAIEVVYYYKNDYLKKLFFDKTIVERMDVKN